MQRVPVAAGEEILYALLDEEDVERLAGRKLSLGSHGYAQMYDGGQVMLLHRWIMGARRRDGRIVDHDNRIKLDCQRSNLKFVTPGESSANREGSAASGYRGVHQSRNGRWQARAKLAGRHYILGTFDDIEVAARVAHAWRVDNMPGYRDRAPQKVSQ